MSWRDISARIIRQVIAETKNADPSVRKQRLFDAYPFGERKYHPYRIWCDEIRRQLGLKPLTQKGGYKAEIIPDEQGHLFDESRN